MAIEIKLPELGEGVDAGDVLDIFVQVGDTIKKDQGIVELETGKATIEVPSPYAGKVTKIHVTEGQTVKIGDVIMTIEAEAGAEVAAPKAAPAAPAAPAPPVAAAPATPPATTSVPPPTVAPKASRPVSTTPSPVVAPTTTADHAAPPAVPSTVPGELAPAGPAMRRFAREVGVDLAQVHGSGQGGRIVRDDILEVVRSSHGNGGGVGRTGTSATGTATSPAVSAATSGGASLGTSVSGLDIPGEPGVDSWGPVQIQKMAKIRETIAAKMHESWSTVPRVTNFDDADVTDLELMRQASKADYAKSGVKLTTMPFLIKAVAMALKANPLLNASIDVPNRKIIYKHYVNVGIAVDTDSGLIVPALRQADQLSVPQIARALGKIADDARTGKFKMEDLRGGTFTISNLGAIGGTYSTPIINTPEVGILLVGRSRKLPIVTANDEIKIRLMMPLSLSYDHRLVDGGAAARFLNDVIGYLSAPSRLLMAP